MWSLTRATFLNIVCFQEFFKWGDHWTLDISQKFPTNSRNYESCFRYRTSYLNGGVNVRGTYFPHTQCRQHLEELIAANFPPFQLWTIDTELSHTLKSAQGRYIWRNTLHNISLALWKESRAVSPIIHSASKCSSRHFIFYWKCVCFDESLKSSIVLHLIAREVAEAVPLR